MAVLQHAGHEVDHLDLYAEGFDPVLGRAERLGYHEVPANRAPVEAYVTRLPPAPSQHFPLPRRATSTAICCAALERRGIRFGLRSFPTAWRSETAAPSGGR